MGNNEKKYSYDPFKIKFKVWSIKEKKYLSLTPQLQFVNGSTKLVCEDDCILEQFTGFIDRKDNEIYMNQSIKTNLNISFGSKNLLIRGFVTMKNGRWVVVDYDDLNVYSLFDILNQCYEFEVIGCDHSPMVIYYE